MTLDVEDMIAEFERDYEVRPARASAKCQTGEQTGEEDGYIAVKSGLSYVPVDGEITAEQLAALKAHWLAEAHAHGPCKGRYLYWRTRPELNALHHPPRERPAKYKMVQIYASFFTSDLDVPVPDGDPVAA